MHRLREHHRANPAAPHLIGPPRLSLSAITGVGSISSAVVSVRCAHSGQWEMGKRVAIAHPDRPVAGRGRPLLMDLVPVLEGSGVKCDRHVPGLTRLQVDPLEAAKRATACWMLGGTA